MIGEKEFIKLCFIPDGNNINGIESIQMEKLLLLKYLLSLIKLLIYIYQININYIVYL